MSSTDQPKSGTKSGQRKKKRSQKPDPAPSPVPDQQNAAKELIDATIASADTASAVAAAMAEPSPSEPAPAVEAPAVAAAPVVAEAPVVTEAAPVEAAPAADTPKPAETSPIGLQTIASAYRDYTRKSIQDAQSYVEKLSGVRSLDKAVEVQTEFAKRACENFVTDSRKIRDLYGEFLMQTLRLPKSPFDRTP